MMKRALILVFFAIIIAVGALALYLSFTVKPEKYRPLIERTLSEKAGRNVSVETIDFSLLGGIFFRVGDVRIAGDTSNPEEEPLRFKEGKFRMKILPLLAGKVRIKEVVIDSPSLLLRKYRDGHLSIQDILRSLTETKEKVEGGQEEGKRAIDLEIESIRVVGGSFTFIAELPGKRTERATITPMNVKITHIGFDRNVKAAFSFSFVEPVPGSIDLSGNVYVPSSLRDAGDITVNVSGEVLEIPVTIEGGITLSGNIPEFEGIVISDDLKVERFQKIYEDITGKALPIRSGGKGRFMVAAGGNPDEFGFEGEMDLTGATLFYLDKFEKYADSELNLIFQGRYLKPNFIISNAEFKVPHLLSSIHGWYDTGRGNYEIESSFDVGKIASIAQYFKDLAPTRISGRLITSVEIRGRGKELKSLAVATDLRKVDLELPGRDVNMKTLGGHIEFTEHDLKLNPLAGLLNGQRISLTGGLDWKGALKGDFTARASYLDLDSILHTHGEAKEGEEKKEPSKDRDLVPDLVKRGTISTAVKVDTLKYRGVEMSGVEGILSLKKGKVTWQEFQVGLFDGKVRSRGSYDLFGKEKPFQMDLSCKGASIFDFFKNVTQYGGFMDGVVDMEVSMRGEGSSITGMRKTFSGKGEIRVTGGKIEGVDLLSDVGGVAGMKEALKGHTGKTRFKRTVTVFQDIHAPFEIREGEAIVKGFSFVTDSLRLQGTARLTGDNRFIFTGDAIIPGEVAQEVGKAGKFLLDREGNLIVPIRISGPLNGPSVVLDPKGFLNRKKEEILQKEKEKIEKKLFDILEKKGVLN